MKECAWCGDDFRGEGLEFDGHFFCSEECLEEYKQDVFGEEAGEEGSDDEQP
jgi:hypothetical protein